MIGAASGSSSEARPSISSAISQAVDAVADQRLVHEQVEELHLGVGDRGERLAVHAHELQEGDEREARRRAPPPCSAAAARRRRRSRLVERAGGEAGRGPDAPDQLGLEPALARRLLAGSSSPRRREQLLHVAVGEPAAAARRRGARRASARARAGARRSAPGPPPPASSSPSRSGTMPSRAPAPQGVGRHVERAGDLAQRRLGDIRARRRKRRNQWFRRCCGQCGPLPRPAAFVKGDALRAALREAAHFPAYCLGRCRKVYRSAAPCQPSCQRSTRSVIRRAGAGARAPGTRGSARRSAW